MKKYIAVDIEYCPTTNQLIQIGAMVVGGQTSFSRFTNVTPDWTATLPDGKCLADILPFDQGKLDVIGVSTEQALTDFFFWCREMEAGWRFVQWGYDDIGHLLNVAQELNLESGIPRHVTKLDIKPIFSQMYLPSLGIKVPGGAGLRKCCDLVDEFVGDPHNAFWDAWNTAWLAERMLKAFRLQQAVLDSQDLQRL